MTATPRMATLDVIRGFAVCGILIMNVVSMGEPGYAYVDPNYYGGAHGADLAAWAIAYIFADGKMRALFTMLFGASLLLITDAAEDRTPGPARTHYSRMIWLLAFGMLHAWFVWYGDVLVEYALCGMIAFVGRQWPVRALLFAAACLIGYEFMQDLVAWHDMTTLHALASGPNPPADAVREWNKVLDAVVPSHAVIAEELRLYRGTIADAFHARAPMTALFQGTFLLMWLPGTLGFVFLGMGLYRSGFWTGAWRRSAYRGMALAGGAALLLYAPLVGLILNHGFDPAFLPFADAMTLLLRPFVALAYAALLILLIGAGLAGRLVDRFAAAGRMAFSNYLGTSLVVTTIFYGYGLGLFGMLSRAQLYLIVVAQWVLILGWSKPWLARFRYGPFEWAWRSLARGTPQPMRKSVAI